MDPSITADIVSILKGISWPGAISLCAYFGYRLYPIWLNKSKGNGSSTTSGTYKDARIDELMDFKVLMETNHNTDLARLLEKDAQNDEVHRQLWKTIDAMRVELQEQGKALARMEGHNQKKQ